MKHLLVTNDFPPKHGGIQSYLWELWRRLPSGRAAVLTTAYPGDTAFDSDQPLPITRHRARVLLPTPTLAARIRAEAARHGAGLVVLDPALPVGAIGPRLGLPFALVLHGAEVTVPGRLWPTRPALSAVIRSAVHVVAAGAYPLAEAGRAVGGEERLPPATVVPSGVDVERFRPLDSAAKAGARLRIGLPGDGPLVVSVSRLVPRKGMDVLLRAAAALRSAHPDLTVAIAGAGRDRRRLEGIARRLRVRAVFLGRVPDEDLAALYACADVFAMLCRSRWFGLEQEGFGIVFLEAAAAGVPQVAGSSGGAGDAVEHGATGYVVDHPSDPRAVAAALARLLADGGLRSHMGQAGRRRAVEEFSYDELARRLDAALHQAEEAARASEP